MRFSQALMRTEKTAPAEAELASHRLLLRAGLARRLGPGLYGYLPLGWQALRRVADGIRAELERLGGQEVHLPLSLTPSYEAAAAALAAGVLDSYRQLPQLLYQQQVRFRDEPRLRGGLWRVREFPGIDAFSFHASTGERDESYRRLLAAAGAALQRMGLATRAAVAGVQETAHDLVVTGPVGDTALLVCDGCGYAAYPEVAEFQRGPAPGQGEPPESLREVPTPGVPTVEAVAQLLGQPVPRIQKALVYTTGDSEGAGGEWFMVLLRGDLQLSEAKLRHLVGAPVRPITRAEAAEAGLPVGYLSHIGLRLNRPLRLLADLSVVGAANMVAGANREGYHLAGVSWERDLQGAEVADLAVAAPGCGCPRCGGPLRSEETIALAGAAVVPAALPAAQGAQVLDESGRPQPVAMARLTLGLGRILAAVLEQHHDENGIIWPPAVAPYRYHLVAVGKEPEVREQADELYAALGTAETLYDDRELSPGIKLKDADLLGLPVRVLVSARSLAAGGAEVTVRRTGERQVLPLTDLPARLQEWVGAQAG